MSSKSPIGPQPPDPYKGYRVEPIEKDKKTPGDRFKPPEEPKASSTLAAHLLFLFHKLLDFFGGKKEGGGSAVENHLLALKQLLEILKSEDRSQDVSFLNSLSEIWHQLLEDLPLLETGPLLPLPFRQFIKEMELYPEGQEHTLGYYLAEYAGQKWLPFPYMELIQQLHAQHQKEPTSSALTRWVGYINVLLNPKGQS